MNVLSISTDRNVATKNSAVRARMIEYGTLFDELHIVVFALQSAGFIDEQIAPNVWLYYTNSSWWYVGDAARRGRAILEARGDALGSWVITAQDPFETGIVGKKLALEFNVPLQIQVHTDFLSSFFKNLSFLNRLRVFAAKWTLPYAAKIRVVSNRIKTSMLESGTKFQSEPIVLPIFVDAQKIEDATFSVNLKEKYPQFKKHIVMASRLTTEKNIPFALQVFSEVRATDPEVGLIIVGSGPQESVIREEIKKLHLEKSVMMEGWQNDVVSYFKTGDILFHTSSYEGYGLVFIEALFSGMGIVSSDVGIAPELLTESFSKYMFSVADHDGAVRSLAEALCAERAEFVPLKEKIKSQIGTKTQYLERYKAVMIA